MKKAKSRGRLKQIPSILMVGFFVVMLLLPSILANAMIGFVPVIPDNQREGRELASWFELILEPGQQQIIEVELTSFSDVDHEVVIQVAIATTGNGGMVHYEPRDVLQDPTQLFTIDEIATLDNNLVIIPARQSVRVPINLTMPTEPFDGVIAAGISLFPLDQAGITVEGIDADAGMGVQNLFQMTMPLILRFNENPTEELLDLRTVRANQIDYRNAISADIHNPMPRFVGDMSINATVRALDGTDILFQRQEYGFNMAPNSSFDFFIPLEGQAFVPGDYMYRVEIETADDTWVFEQVFSISPEEARAFNELDVSIVRYPLWWFIAGGAVLLLILILIFFKLFGKKTKKTQEVMIEDLIKQMEAEARESQ